jgi:hypothetical protein
MVHVFRLEDVGDRAGTAPATGARARSPGAVAAAARGRGS